MVRGSKDYSVERDSIMNLVSKASELAMEKSNYLKDMQKWEKCPALFDIKAFGGKNAVGDFGENLVHEWHKERGVTSAIIKKGHDVHSGEKKIEVKTAFESRMGTFWFNQIYYADPKTGVTKDWDCLIFVFVYPDRVELWEIERPENPEDHFNWNNGWSWQKKGSEKLDQSKWKMIDCLPTCELGE